MPKSLRPVFLLLFLLNCAHVGFAQTQTPASPVLRSSTNLVQLNVIVQDKSGNPIEGLKKEDFQIFDEGRSQQIAVFSAHGSKITADLSANPVHPANFFSNRGDQSGQGTGSVTIILFDALNTEFIDQGYARQQIIKFLGQVHPQDHVAIYVLTSKVTVLCDFTQNAASLLRAVQNYSSQPTASLDASAPDPMDAIATPVTFTTDINPADVKSFLQAASGQFSDLNIIYRAEVTTSALEAIANHASRIPGRKNLIWISTSFPMALGFGAETMFQVSGRDQNFDPELQRASRALNQANMAIYPIDARGSIAPKAYGVANPARFNPRRLPTANGNIAPDPRYFDTMNALAERTGGKAAYNTNDIEGAVERAISDGQMTYTVGFYPTHGKWDGKFHELKVQVAAKGSTLRYRRGYFAALDPPSTPKTNHDSLNAALTSPLEWTNLDLQVALKGFAAATRTLSLQVGLDTHELSFEKVGNRWNEKLDVTLVQLGADNKAIRSETKNLDFNLEQDSYEKLLSIGTRFSGDLSLDPGVVALRIAAQDSNGSIGTVTVPLTRFLESGASAKSN